LLLSFIWRRGIDTLLFTGAILAFTSPMSLEKAREVVASALIHPNHLQLCRAPGKIIDSSLLVYYPTPQAVLE
jgi:hypothetical protein